MKRSLCMILIFAFCFTFFGCQQDQPKLQSPVNFYYPRLEPTHGSADSLIAPVPTEGSGYADDPTGLLNLYLLGPSDESFVSPFPSGTVLLSLSVTEDTIHLQLNKSFAQLTGIDLTLACACLTLTVIELTDAEYVSITAENTTLDGSAQIIMDRSCLTLLDVYDPEST